MTDNPNQQNVSYEALKDGMERRYQEGLVNHRYNGWHADEFATLEYLVADSIDEEGDEHDRATQEASDKVLRAFVKRDAESGGGCDGSRTDGGAVPLVKTGNLGDLEKTGTVSSAPGIVTLGYLGNSSENSPVSGSSCVTPKVKHGGFDGGSKIHYFGTWNEEAFVTLTGRLESAKTSISSTNQSNGDDKLQPGELSLVGLAVRLYLTGSGKGLPSYYAYHIQFAGFDVFIHRDMSPKNNNPQICVDYRAESILTYGSIYAAQDVLLDFLSTLGFTMTRNRLSRTDLQVMLDVPVSKFTNLFLDNKCVGKGRNWTINGKRKKWGNLIETFSIGDKKRIQLCIYDKRLEVEAKWNPDDELKYRKTIENIGTEWWDDKKRPVTRVEYRIGRDVLHEFGIESLEDFRRYERAIVQYLTHDWFRLLAKEKVRGTENDAAIHPIWERVQSLFFQYFTCAEVPAVQWKKPIRLSADSKTLNKQGMGCLASAVAYSSAPLTGEKSLQHAMCDNVRELVDEKLYRKALYKRRMSEIKQGVIFDKPPYRLEFDDDQLERKHLARLGREKTLTDFLSPTLFMQERR